MNLALLNAWDPESGTLNVIIETPKGNRNKLKYNTEEGLFELSKVLPRGLIFPFDFGFIPSTAADDGDPLDILALLDEPVPVGCKIPARLIGVIEAEQTEDGEAERNDRLIAVAEHSHEHKDIRSLKNLNKQVLQEIEHFFVSLCEMVDKRFKPVGRHGPNSAEKLVKQAVKRFRRKHGRRQAQGSSNGQSKVGKRLKDDSGLA